MNPAAEENVKRMAEKYGVQWTENMDHEDILVHYYEEKGFKKVHKCPEWDFLAIHEDLPEFDACLCEFD
jgi:hypothetical protein